MEGDEPTSFIRIIMPSILRNHKMVLPKTFVEARGDELSNFVKLHDPVGGIWRVGLKREGELIWLVDGWKRFMDHYSIRFGYMLMFEYRGRSEFDVHIFDLTCTEIAYSPPIEAEEIEKEEAISPSSEDFEIFRGADKALREANMLKTDNPSFVVALKHYHVGHSSVLNVPRQFARDYLSEVDEYINLQNYEGNKWPIRRIKNKDGAHALSQGWKRFVRDNGLKEGDVCVFEVVQSGGSILKNVPQKFSREYFSKFDEDMNLQDSEGNKWPIRCVKNQGRYLLSKGWKQFVRDNGLKEGDVCVFEVVQSGGSILKVSIFRGD